MEHSHENTQGSMSEDAARTKERLKEQGADAVHRMQARGTEMLDEQKSRLCEEIHHYSSALRRAAESLHEDDDERVATAADRMADELEGASDYLEKTPVSRIYCDAEDLARRRPEWVFGGLFLAGLAVGRFLKASGKNRLAEEPGANYRSRQREYDEERNLPADASLYAPTSPPAYAQSPTGEEPYSGAEPYVRSAGSLEE